MPLIESQSQGKLSSIKFAIDSATRQLLTFYCEYSHNKVDPIIVGALKMLFKADSDFGPWVEQKKRQLASQQQNPAANSKFPAPKTEAADAKRNS